MLEDILGRLENELEEDAPCIEHGWSTRTTREHVEDRMKVRYVYLFLCIVGIVLPYWQFLPWLMENGFDLRLLWMDLFSNRVSGFFGLDVFVSAAVAFVFFAAEGRRASVRGAWLAAAATLAFGVSAGLPLFLAQRERALEANRRAG